jgi:sulfur carrier protein
VSEIELVVNGEPRRAAAGESVLDLLRRLDLDPRSVAIERNGEIVRRARLADARLAPGDRIEIVRFVQGG